MRRSRRQRAQTFITAALAMTAMLGAVSMVIDAGIFFIIQRQLQTAADAGALAAVWYDPACDSTNLAWLAAGCQGANANVTAAECQVPPNSNIPNGEKPCTAAVEAVKANWSQVLGLCVGPNISDGSVKVQVLAYPGLPPGFQSINVPHVTPYVVSVSCNAPHWFGQVLPGVIPTVQLSASAAAALGWLQPNGQLAGDPPPPSPPTPKLVARLIL